MEAFWDVLGTFMLVFVFLMLTFLPEIWASIV